MKHVVSKWGNSLAIRIPNQFAQELNLTEGATVNIELRGNELVVKPIKKRRTYVLEDLVNKITDENRHEAVDFGDQAGKEVWCFIVLNKER
ncbi:growth regulator [Leptolyngbyaceae cyanobacterium JSC-12]|nr:growth regulator [Leptolyngbyaceae cyanobacterium JSC-12]